FLYFFIPLPLLPVMLIDFRSPLSYTVLTGVAAPSTKERRINMHNDELFSSFQVRNYQLADWKYEKIMEEIRDFEKSLDNDHEIALKLASFGSAVTMVVTSIGYQNPDMLYFYGYVNGKDSQLIQHANQLNFLITSVEREDKTKPARRIGFRAPDDADE
ncbi:DUF6173 family protein, partial [Hungatella hathewayi]